ncbi:hypothetical protein PR202_ga03584 [Eleusine coracana subsp. coracana]|uniref:Uncharacterized protein n=1 Tax=Eleusine coracana subsp. coracana TaxID=191504 RepID=A0AAV5BQ78_ELECO|nr:hypothetical protein PR202_ga03584 [Eleusine coracana subsp. coracana]
MVPTRAANKRTVAEALEGFRCSWCCYCSSVGSVLSAVQRGFRNGPSTWGAGYPCLVPILLRNDCVFNGVAPSLSTILTMAGDEARLWSMAGDEARLWSMAGAKGLSLLTGHDVGD